MWELGWANDHLTDVWHCFVNGRSLCRSAYLWGNVQKRDHCAEGNCPECQRILESMVLA